MNQALLLAACLVAASPVHAQEAGSERPLIELSFSRASGRAGEDVQLPLQLTGDGTVTAPFRITLQFRRSVLSYRGFETAYLAQYAGWTMSARVQESKPDDPTAVLEILVTPSEKNFFPSGVVAYVQFTIQQNVPDGDILIDAALRLPASGSLVAKAQPAKVTVYSKLVPACFFYMH